MSPGTRSRASISRRMPSRRTVARRASSRSSASMARCARISRANPSPTFSASTAAMARASAMSCVAAATIAPATSSSTTTLLNCAASTTHHDAGRPAEARSVRRRRAVRGRPPSRGRRGSRPASPAPRPMTASCQAGLARLLIACAAAGAIASGTRKPDTTHPHWICGQSAADRIVDAEHFAAGGIFPRASHESAAIVAVHSGGRDGVVCAQTAGRMM